MNERCHSKILNMFKKNDKLFSNFSFSFRLASNYRKSGLLS